MKGVIDGGRFDEYSNLYWWSIGLFIIYNIVVFIIAKYFSRKSNDKGYFALIFLNLLLKLFFVIGIPVIYFVEMEPSDNRFIIPYVGIYVVFTIFETWYLNQSAIMRNVKDSK